MVGTVLNLICQKKTVLKETMQTQKKNCCFLLLRFYKYPGMFETKMESFDLTRKRAEENGFFMVDHYWLLFVS